MSALASNSSQMTSSQHLQCSSADWKHVYDSTGSEARATVGAAHGQCSGYEFVHINRVSASRYGDIADHQAQLSSELHASLTPEAPWGDRL